MQVASFPHDPPPRWNHPVLALGNFDGLHRGHMKIIDRVRQRAGERGGTPAAMTFDPHPPRVLRPDKAPPLLMTRDQKIEALGRSGMQGVALVTFTHELSLWEPEMFVKTVLVEWLHVTEVWVGANFLFGHDRAGTFSVLRTLGMRYGFRAEKIDPVRYKDFVVSSTRVRRLVTEGRVDEAGALLGHHYFIDGEVVRGAGRGREIGVPTANLQTANELVPPGGRLRHAHHGGRDRDAVRHQYRHAADVRRHDHPGHRDAPAQRRTGPVRAVDAPVVRAAHARRAGVPRRRRLARADRRRYAQRAAAVRPDFAVESVDMSQSAGAVRNGLVLRFSVPVSGELRAIAGELAAKVAAQLGVRDVGDGGLAAAIEDLAVQVEPGADDDLAFEFHKVDQRAQGRSAV